MRILFAVLASLIVTLPALAQRYTADISRVPAGGIIIAEIAFGEDLMERADDIGERELERLARTLRADFEREMREAGLTTHEIMASTLYITIEDAVPNRPTFNQRGAGGLDFRSFGIGGADLSAELRDGNNETVATFSYGWRTPQIEDAQFASTWTDAHRTFDRFARRVSEGLAEVQASGS